MSILYIPQGRALEYAVLAAAPFRGCPYRCRYCFNPNALHQTPEEFAKAKPRYEVLKLQEKELQQCTDPAYKNERVLLSFTCDPYPPFDAKPALTRSVIELLHRYDHPVCILTKGGFLSRRDLDLLGPGDQYATSLVFKDEFLRQKYEPGAAPTADRIAVLQEAHDMGIFTWVSCEPVIMPRQTLQLIRDTHTFVDHYKVGKLNHNSLDNPEQYIPEAEGINWAMFGSEAMDLLQQLKVRYYIKTDLRRCMA
jgi:DNA repair photolyase